MSGDLRAVVIVDYQNVHLTGHGLYESTRLLPRHQALVDPLMFARRLLQVRNARQKEGVMSRDTVDRCRGTSLHFRSWFGGRVCVRGVGSPWWCRG